MHTGDPLKNLSAALGRIPSGVFVLTVARDAVETGMLASWVQQCAFKPPMISFAVQKGRAVAELLSNNAVFTLNILEAAQTDMIAHFGKGFALTENAFQDIDIQRVAPYGPILQEAHAYLHAAVVGRYAAGDHDLFLAEVAAGGQLDDSQPMVHIRKNGFHY
ncbi:MAG: flavin reductase family protein [Planctomycetes bacterium]|nr:flavin reductase family protein [Planctomycetota bacterium]